MPQEVNQTVRTTFVKGLLTEYSELNFPEDASTDELNCDLKSAGNRTKRLGIEYETSYVLTDETYPDDQLYHTGTWENVGGDSDLEYLVVQTGGYLRFFLKGSQPLSGGAVPTSDVDSTVYIVDMSPYEYVGGLGAQGSKVSLASINGHLVVASPQIETFYISRDNTDGTFTLTQIEFKVRDFIFFGDPDDRTEEDATPAIGRQYDTLNTGWVGTKGAAALTTYEASESAYPPLTHPWYSGKDASGNFSVSEWQKVYAGNTVTANGHFIIDLFNPDRDGASGLTSVAFYDGRDIQVPTTRFNTVAAYAGRVFYAGVDSNIYFSQLIEDISMIGDCYQINDPTSEELSDLLDTDGGYVRIPAANGIRHLHVYGASLLVFADNGVWKISGVDDVFRATEYSVTKITDFGLAFRSSFVSGSNAQPFWWSYTGIHSVVVTDQGAVQEINISKNTVQTFWNNIDSTAKSYVVGAYDGIANKVLWLYPNDEEPIEFKLNNILFLDVDLQAFYPWKFSDKASDTPYIVGTSFFDGAGALETIFNVVDSNGDNVLDGSGNEVVVTRVSGSIGASNITFLVKDPSGSLTFATATDTSFYDWGEADYSAYAESAYNFIGDMGRRKTSPYITVLMRLTETGWTAIDGGYSPTRNSSLKVSAYWDFRSTASSTAQEAYRFKYPLVVDVDSLDSFNYPTSVIMTRLRLRGRGRVVKLRFEGQPGKDFNLLGWETLDARKSTY